MDKQWGKPISFEYSKAATPDLKPILPQILSSTPKQTISHMVVHDFAQDYGLAFRATTPVCLTAFIFVNAGDSFSFQANASSNLVVVVAGEGRVQSDYGVVNVSKYDAVSLPNTAQITLTATTDMKIYWMCDEPLINRLGATPTHATFKPTKYSYKDYIEPEVIRHNSKPDADQLNRNGIIFANEMCLDTKTVTPTLWALYNVINPRSIQLPHRHNSIALDLCLYAPTSGVYTLMSNKIDSSGKLIDPLRMDWGSGQAFTTPPGWWHSHHNESDELAIVFPMQDAGLHTYLRTLDIQFIK